MSAVLLDPRHLLAITVNAFRLGLGTLHARTAAYDLSRDADRLALARRLYRANARSVNHRYGERNRLTDPALQDAAAARGLEDAQPALSAAALCKALDCLDYQSCERPDWQGSGEQGLIEDLLARAARRVHGAKTHEDPSEAVRFVPDYRAAAWFVCLE